MKCPHCDQDVVLPDNSKTNMRSYKESCVTITECCGKIVHARIHHSYSVSKPHNTIIEDDWGRRGKV